MPPNMPEKHFPVSWDEFHRDARALAWRLAAAGPFQVIVAITRGGLVPAGIVARELRVLKPVADGILALGGQGVLIVDDLVDTGRTAKLVRDVLPKAHFASVYAKPLGKPMVDTFITEVSQDTWIFFPWDTGLAFQPPIKEGGE